MTYYTREEQKNKSNRPEKYLLYKNSDNYSKKNKNKQ